MKANVKKIEWCPQPRMALPISKTRISASTLAFVLVAEVLVLLVIPISYYALLAPKPEIVLMQELPLTNDQIKAAWPNLPTAAEIVSNSSSEPYMAVDPSCATYYDVTNNTQLNIPDFKDGGIIPITYHIWLQNGNTMVLVPSAYLATNHPPTYLATGGPSTSTSEQAGFLGTSLPVDYGIIALVVIASTALALAGYFISVRRRRLQTKLQSM